MKLEFEDAAAPLARLIGHSVAAAFGFCGLAVISLVPIEVLKLLSVLGVPELLQPLQVLEETLLFADVCLFAVIFLSGIASSPPRLSQRRNVALEPLCGRATVINRLKHEFVLGYREGWRNFWSPFTGLWRSLVESWRAHLGPRKS